MATDIGLHSPLPPDQFDALADVLGDAPDTVISVHLLRRRMCKVHLVGNPEAFAACVIRQDPVPAELMAFGTDADALWQLLERMDEWTHVNVASTWGDEVTTAMARGTGQSVRRYGDIYHTLTQAAPTIVHPAVRMLAQADQPLLECAPKRLRPDGYRDLDTALAEGVVAGGIVNEQLVALAHTNARTPRHADIGVYTEEGFRNRGLSTAASAVVAREVMAAGQVPVWSAGETNAASLHVAGKLGFREVFRRVYLSFQP